jgi:hypothetical protein
VKCEKEGCEREAVDQLRFTDKIRPHLDVDHPVGLCDERIREAQRFPENAVGAVKKWLKAD